MIPLSLLVSKVLSHHGQNHQILIPYHHMFAKSPWSPIDKNCLRSPSPFWRTPRSFPSFLDQRFWQTDSSHQASVALTCDFHWISQWGTVRDEHLYYHSNQFHIISRVPDTCLLIFCGGGGCLKCRKFVYFSLSLCVCPELIESSRRNFSWKAHGRHSSRKTMKKTHLAGLIEQSHAMPCYTYHQV